MAIYYIYIQYQWKMKRTIKKSYWCTTESGESGSTNPLYGLSCAKQGGKLITYGKNSQLTNVAYMPKCYFLSIKCKNKKINTFVHHISSNLLTNLLQVPSNTISIIACIDAWIIVFLYLLRRYILLLCVFIILTYYIMSFVTLYHFL